MDEARVAQLEEGLGELNEGLNKRVSQIRDNLQMIARLLEQQKTQREQTFEQRTKEYQDMELQFNQAIDAEIQVNLLINIFDSQGKRERLR